MKIRTIGFAAVAAFTLAASVLIVPAAWGTATTDEPITVADGPVGVAFSPNGRFAYVLSAENIRVLSKIDVASGTVVGTLDLSGNGRASTLAVSPDGTVAYVTFETVSTYIDVIDLGTFQLEQPIALANYAYGVAFSSDSETAYATLRDSNSVAIIDVSEGEVSDTFSLGTSPVNVAIAPNDSILLVGANGSEDEGSVWVRNVANDANVAQITVGARPTSIVITPDGTKAYVGDASGAVSVISLSSYEVIKTFEAPEPGYEFTKLAMSPDGTKAFFALNYSSSLFVIDIATDALESSTALLGDIPRDLAISPRGDVLYSANQNSDSVSVIRMDPRLSTIWVTDESTSDASITLASGERTAVLTPVDFGTAAYSHTLQTKEAEATLTVDDESGLLWGWGVTIEASDLAWASPSDATNADRDIPASSLSVSSTSAVETIVGDLFVGMKLNSDQALGSAVNIVSTAPEQGNGEYDVPLTFTVDIPGNAASGTYTGTLTTTIAAAP